MDPQPPPAPAVPRPPPTGGGPGAAPRLSRAAAVGLGGLFLLLAVLQAVVILRKPSDATAPGELLGDVLDPEAVRTVLTSEDAAAPRPVGVVVHRDASRVLVLRAPGLPAPAAGAAYVLWGIPRGGGAARRLGRFTSGHRDVDLVVRDAPPRGTFASLVVSLERDPAAAAPTAVLAAGAVP